MTEELFWKYMQYGGGEELGDPLKPFECVERLNQDLVVCYRDFHKGAIYWTSETDVSVVVEEKILKYWRLMVPPDSVVLGYPTRDPKTDGRDRVYNRFQHGTIYYDPSLGKCKHILEGRQDILRRVSICTAAGLWLIIALIVGVSSNGGGIFKGLFIVVSLLLSALTVILLEFLWKQLTSNDGS